MADVHLLSRAIWPSTVCLIICVIHQSTLQRLRDHRKLTCSLLTSTLSTLEVLPRNALHKSTYLLTYTGRWMSCRQRSALVSKGVTAQMLPNSWLHMNAHCISTDALHKACCSSVSKSCNVIGGSTNMQVLNSGCVLNLKDLHVDHLIMCRNIWYLLFTLHNKAPVVSLPWHPVPSVASCQPEAHSSHDFGVSSVHDLTHDVWHAIHNTHNTSMPLLQIWSGAQFTKKILWWT